MRRRPLRASSSISRSVPPTQKLVVRGVYRFVRNPMISGVLSILLGEAALFASPALLWWFVVAAAVNIVYIPLSEERGLERRFGDDYLAYKRNVPRWIPRLKPWIPPRDDTREERQHPRSGRRGKTSSVSSSAPIL